MLALAFYYDRHPLIGSAHPETIGNAKKNAECHRFVIPTTDNNGNMYLC